MLRALFFVVVLLLWVLGHRFMGTDRVARA